MKQTWENGENIILDPILENGKKAQIWAPKLF